MLHTDLPSTCTLMLQTCLLWYIRDTVNTLCLAIAARASFSVAFGESKCFLLDFAGFNAIRTLQATSRADGKSMKVPLEALKKPDFMARKLLSNMSRAALARRVLCPHQKKNVVPSQNFVDKDSKRVQFLHAPASSSLEKHWKTKEKVFLTKYFSV